MVKSLRLKRETDVSIGLAIRSLASRTYSVRARGANPYELAELTSRIRVLKNQLRRMPNSTLHKWIASIEREVDSMRQDPGPYCC